MSNEAAIAPAAPTSQPQTSESSSQSGSSGGSHVQLKRSLAGHGHDVQASMLAPRPGQAPGPGGNTQAAPEPGQAPVQRSLPQSTRNVQRVAPPAPAAGGMTDPAPAPPIGANVEADVKTYCAPDPVAMQKLADVDSEAYMEDVAPGPARTAFYREVGQYINANHATLQPSTIYSAIFNRAAGPYKMKGKKIDAATIGGLCSRTAGVGGFWQRQIDQSIFINQAATELGLPATDPDVVAVGRAKFMAAAKAGGELKPYFKGGAMLAPTGYPAWFTPDKVRIDSNSDTAFGDLMRIYALQPEWFAEGNVHFEVDPTAGAQVLRKPTAYDGMQSSLWVARNQPGDTYGMTGGGAREYLGENVPVDAIKSCRGVIPSEDFLGQVTTLQSRAVAKFLEANPQIKAELDALKARADALPDTDPAKAVVKARISEIQGWTPNLTDWVLRGQTTFLTSHIGVKIRDAKAALDTVNAATTEQRTTPTPTPTPATLVNPAPGP